MPNTFGTDILIQAEDLDAAAAFYVENLGFTISGRWDNLLGLEGPNINLYIERGPPLGPVLEVTVGDVEAAKDRLVRRGATVIKDEPHFPRCYVRDPNGLIYNLKA